jgi:type I restriction enzyme S subunit
MSSEWQEPSLADICSDVSYGYTESATDEQVGPKFLRITDIQGGTIDWDAVPFCPATDASVTKYRLEIGDIVVARTGNSTGENAQINSEPPSAVFASYLIRFRPDAKQVNPFFIGYQLRSDRFRQHVLAVRSGSAQPGANAKQLGVFPIRLIPRQLQDSAVEILRSIDDRIALLRETNATLEAIAQAMFKSWFVDFDPVHAKQQGRAPDGMSEATAALFPDSFEELELGLVPKGWKVAPIGDVVESVGGGTPDTKELSYWEGGVHCWTTPKDLSGIQSPVLLTTERKLTDKGLAKVSSGLLPAGSLLLSSRAPIGYLAIAQVPMAINQGYIGMLPNSKLPPLFMLFWCRQNMEIIKGRANGSTFMEISKKAFRPIPAVVPPASVIDVFMQVAGAMFERIVSNEQQAQTLATLRDTLLPRLISGQLRLPDVEGVLQ